MKAISIMLLGAGLWMGLASCEMKDEILGDKELSGETGTLALGVVTNDATNTVVTKADAGDATINAFPVTIYDATGEVYESYAHYSEMPDELRMPVGEYRVEAYSDGEFKTEMTEPWFKGEESFSIVKDGTNHVEIECEMQNLPITIEPDGDFLNEFQSGWTITLDDGKGSILTFTNKDTAPYKKYWKIAEGVTSISVNVEATSSTGDKVTQHYTCTKKNAAEEHPGDTDNFVGGDALVIKLSPEVAEVTLEMTIGISVDLSFVEQPDETVEIPVEIEDGTDDPDDPDDKPVQPGTENAPEIDIPQLVYTLPADLSKAETANAVIKISTAGNPDNELERMIVKITPDSEGFKSALGFAVPDLLNGMDLVGRTDIEPVLGIIVEGIKVPAKEGVTEYSFPVGKFFSVLNEPDMGATTSTGHTFELDVYDSAGAHTPITLRIVVEGE